MRVFRKYRNLPSETYFSKIGHARNLSLSLQKGQNKKTKSRSLSDIILLDISFYIKIYYITPTRIEMYNGLEFYEN